MAALVLFAGCNKDKETQGTTLKASIEQQKGDSKTSLNPTNGAINWTAGDKIIVYNGTSSATFTLSAGAGSTNGTFNYAGEFEITDDAKAAYPETCVITDNGMTFTLPEEQNLASPGSFANGANPMLGIKAGDGFTFVSVCGGLGLSLTGDNVDITAIEIVSENEMLTGTYTGYFNNDNIDVANGTNSVRLNCTTTLTAEPKEFYIVLPVGVLSNGFTLNIYNGTADPIFTKTTTTDLTVELNKVKKMNALEVTVETGDTHEYVDLGLPSGLLWATCNVGANSPEECGNYYAWGETQPKDYYGWENYLFYGEGEYPWITCTKYNHNGLTLLPEDDPATQWGASWRMPTVEDWQELFDNTTNEWTTQNGVNGVLLTALNGNSLFLPETGWWNLDEIQFDYSKYWSSSVDYYWPNVFANIFDVRTWGGVFDIEIYRESRSAGLPVRPVRNAE